MLRCFKSPEYGLCWWVFHMNLRIMCILLLLDELVYKYPLYLVDWWCCWIQVCSYWISACWICQFLIEGLWSVHYNSGFFYFSLHLYWFLSHTFWYSFVRHIYIKDCYTFLEIDPLSIMQCPIFICDSFPFPKLALPEINIASLAIFWLTVAWYILLQLFFV